ncbi:MAG: hypothetical protein J6J35_00765 [Alphaproteobacteria bacterium]|nr:hypothetical protein [Alphaproteobacteria bacterium]
MLQDEELKDPFKIMEQSLLPVFKEGVAIAKKISGNPTYFRDDYKAARRLYAMALVSLAINSVNNGSLSDDEKKKNIENIDLSNERYFYQADSEMRKKENIFKRPEIVAFKQEMKKLNAGYFDDVCVQECLGVVEADAAIGIWSEEQPVISPDGRVLDWKKAVKSNIFKFATGGLKHDLFVQKMNKASKENKWDKKEWNANYPLINRECEKIMELEITKHIKNKQCAVPLDLSKDR